MELVIDGYSLLHARHAGKLSNGDHIRRYREQLLRDLLAMNPQPADLIHVVFDGRGDTVGIDRSTPDFLNVVFSKSGQTADALIESLASRHTEPASLWIVSNDRAILDLVAARGCRVESAGQFLRGFLDRSVRGRHPSHIQAPPKRPTLGDIFPPDL